MPQLLHLLGEIVDRVTAISLDRRSHPEVSVKFDLSRLSHSELMELIVTLSTSAGLTVSRKRLHASERALPFAPRGLSRTDAAAYIGVGATLFDEMVKDGRMPRPKAIKSRRVWDRLALDVHFDDLPEVEEADPFAFIDG